MGLREVLPHEDTPLAPLKGGIRGVMNVAGGIRRVINVAGRIRGVSNVARRICVTGVNSPLEGGGRGGVSFVKS